MYCTGKSYNITCSIIWPVWLNGWVSVYSIKGCGFKSSDIALVSIWHLYGVWVYSETHTWHDQNIQSNAPYR